MDYQSDSDSSVASYEDVGRAPSPYDYDDYRASRRPVSWGGPDFFARRHRAGDKDKDSPEDKRPSGPPPDISYVFRYRLMHGKLVEVRRSAKPIDSDQIDLPEEKTSSSPPSKSILEIVTTVSRASLLSPRRRRRNYSPSPSTPPSPPVYDHYGSFQDHRDQNVRTGYEEGQKQTKLVINSEHIINALRAVVVYPSFHTKGQSMTVPAPYALLVHHREALARHKDNQPATHSDEYKETTIKHIDILLEWLDQTMGQQVSQELELRKKDIPSATFDKIWLLFKAGDVVFAQENMKWTPFVVSSAYSSGHVAEDVPPSTYSVVCWKLTASASADRLSRRMRMFSIQPFSGEEPISSLRVIPSAFFRGDDGKTEPADVIKKETELGKLAWKYHSSGPAYMAYSGALAREWRPDSEWDYENETPTGYMAGRVVVDSQGYKKYGLDCPGGVRRSPPPRHSIPRNDRSIRMDTLPYLTPRCGCEACGQSDEKRALSPYAEMIKDLDPSKHKKPDSDLYFLVLSNVVPAFLLSERRWGYCDVNYLRDISFDKDAFKSLVLEDDIKLTVKALIGQFGNQKGKVSPWPKDLVVKNKGQGRIFLLHGSPGVGKTCTAEAAAELSKRPLLSLTSGDLTTAAFAVERNLEYFLALSERFGAVVLLDEADVYLETRRSRDIRRNGLVSIFLRGLEYYRGILFLTTNRVEQFDPAFVSRIHVALHYKSLTDANREKIWLNSFERLERDSRGKVHVSVATREYAYQSRDIASLKWNGREIRNALQTAVGLAETEGDEEEEEREGKEGKEGGGGGGGVTTVTDKHLRAVVKMSRSFKDYLKKHGVGKGRSLEDDDDMDDDDADDDSDDSMAPLPPW